jgi:hypothetical protein
MSMLAVDLLGAGATARFNIKCPFLIAAGERGWLPADRAGELYDGMNATGGDVTLKIFTGEETASTGHATIRHLPMWPSLTHKYHSGQTGRERPVRNSVLGIGGVCMFSFRLTNARISCLYQLFLSGNEVLPSK